MAALPAKLSQVDEVGEALGKEGECPHRRIARPLERHAVVVGVQERRAHEAEEEDSCNHVAITWQSHGNHMAITWQSHGNHMATTWQPHGNHMATTWQSHGRAHEA